MSGKGRPWRNRQALFPVEAPGPARRVLSHVMYLKRQTFQESAMNAICCANKANPARKLFSWDKHSSQRNVKVYAGNWNFTVAALSHLQEPDDLWIRAAINTYSVSVSQLKTFFVNDIRKKRHAVFSALKSIIKCFIRYNMSKKYKYLRCKFCFC